MGDDTSPNVVRIVRVLRDDAGPDVIRIGTLPDELVASWPDATTKEVILTRERRRHYLARHPEIIVDEPVLIETVMRPAEVHRNKRDARIAILYSRLGDGFYLRIPVWISNRLDRQNSVLSLRRARAREVEAGRRAGRLVWKREVR